MEIISSVSLLIKDLGFPIFVACYLMFDLSKRLKRIESHLDKMNGKLAQVEKKRG